MLTDTWQRLLDLPPRVRYALLGGVGLVLLLLVAMSMGGSDPESDFQVADSGAGNEQAVVEPAVPETPGEPGTQPPGTTVGDQQQQPTMAPVGETAGGSSDGFVRPEDDIRLERDLNGRLPPPAPREKTPPEIAAEAPDDVKFAGQVLTRFSETLKGCLRARQKAPLDCLEVATQAAPGVEYNDGRLVGDLEQDVEFELIRRLPSGFKVWLIYTKGTECHGYSDKWDSCAAW